MRNSTPHPVDFFGGIRRAGTAFIILAAHVAVLYAAAVLRPSTTPRTVAGPLSAHFVETSEPQKVWEPPRVTPEVPVPDVRVPTAPLIEIPREQSRKSHPLVARSAPPKSVTSSSETAPRLISTVEYVREPSPRYPPQSRRLREQGLVVLRVVIDEKGQACDIEVESSSGHERLDRAAKEAVARAAFRPYVENGAPRRALVLIPIEFSLSSGAV